MSARKPLPEGCTGSVDCPVTGHVNVTRKGAVTRFTHIRLTPGQERTRQERRTDIDTAFALSWSAAEAAGLAVLEHRTLISICAAHGIIGSDAGTSIRTMMKRLPDTCTRLAYDTHGNFIGLAQFADALRRLLDRLNTQERYSALTVLFGSDAARVGSVLACHGTPADTTCNTTALAASTEGE